MEILSAMDHGNFVLCLFCSSFRLTRRAYSFDVNDVYCITIFINLSFSNLDSTVDEGRRHRQMVFSAD
jgi:hypothetical protein